MILPFFERSGLSQREQQLASAATLVFGVLLIIALPVGLSFKVSSRAQENEELRSALSAVQGARVKVKERQAQRESIASRYKQAPALAGLVETTARANKVDISDSTDRPELPIGKRYAERTSTMHIKKSGLLPIVRFLEGIEKSDFPITVSRLNVRKRSSEPDSYDVEIGVSAFDRHEIADKKDAKEADKK